MASPSWLRAALCTLPPLALLAGGFQEARHSMSLSAFPPLPDDRRPGLSIVVAARDEAENLRSALSSLLEQDYPELQVILVDDRSSDGTSEIADQVKLDHPRGDRLTVIHNKELPEGWLGKVHALHLGVQASRHPLVLLTDADISFSPTALKTAVTAQQVLGADHLAVAPRFQVDGFWEPVMVAYFFLLFSLRFAPSTVHRKKDRFVGVGAFNMVTREMLQRLEWLEPLRMQVIDDVFLGRMVKARGGRQFALLGQKELSVRWFRGLSGIVTGLEKNAYAGLNYSLPTTLLASLCALAPLWIPLFLACSGGIGLALAFYLFEIVLGALLSKVADLPPWTGLAYPLAGAALAFTMLRSAYLAEKRQAVVWRDTRYSLAELRLAHQSFVEREKL